LPEAEEEEAIGFLQELEELDDVQYVYSNLE
jgi:transcriptional/translational regulatory protein YebC/TACO1